MRNNAMTDLNECRILRQSLLPHRTTCFSASLRLIRPMATADPRPPSRLLAWLQLMRLPNVFTAMADVAMGFLFTHPSLEPLGVFCLLLLSSSCLYTAGMVLNDVFDLEMDRRERPQRPLPSGRMSVEDGHAIGLVAGVLGHRGGVGGGDFRATQFARNRWQWSWRPRWCFYDAYAKRTRWWAGSDGGVPSVQCRSGNERLADNAAVDDRGRDGCRRNRVVHRRRNWFARREAATSERWQLSMGTLIAAAGMLMLVVLRWCCRMNGL